MRVCHAIFSNPWAARSGGGQYAVHRIATAMAAAGHDVHVLYSRLDADRPDQDPGYAVHWTRFREVSDLNLDFAPHFLALGRLLASRAFDVVFCHGENGAWFPWLCRRYGVELHGVLHPSHLPALAPWHRWEFADGDALNYRLLSRVLQRCAVVHVFSAFSERLAGRLVRDGRPRIRRSSFGIERAWVGAAPRRRRPAGARSLTGISWGRLERGKGQEALIEAFAMLRADGVDARLILVGSGSQGGALRAAAAGLGVDVSFPGRLGHAQIRETLSRADVAVFLSEAESFGLAIAEASASGIPTFAGRFGGVADALSDGRGGTLVDPPCAERMAACLRAFIASPGPFEALADDARAIGADRDWTSTAASMLRPIRP